MTNLIDILRAQPVWKTTPSAKILFQELFSKSDHKGDVTIPNIGEFQESTGLNANHYHTAMKVLLLGKHVEKVALGHFRIPSYKLIASLLAQKAPSVASAPKPPSAANHMGTDQLPAAQRPSRPFTPLGDVGHVEGNYTTRDDGETIYGADGAITRLRPGQHVAPVAPKPSVPVPYSSITPRGRFPASAPKTTKSVVIMPPPRIVTIRKPDMTTLR